MKFILEVFEGPLDLLLYLIKKNEIDIHDIPIARITSQYLAYIEAMKILNLNVAGEFLVMASTLIHIKSKILIPSEGLNEEDMEDDPRRELVEQLLEYQKYKEIAQQFSQKEQERHNVFTRPEGEWEEFTEGEVNFKDISISEFFDAFSNVLDVIRAKEPRFLEQDEVTLKEKVREILDRLRRENSFTLASLCEKAKTRITIVVTILALMELARLKELTLIQRERFGEILIERLNITGKEKWTSLN